LQQLGWTNGQNLEIDALWTNGDESRIAQLAKELVAREPAVILARATPVTTALRKETRYDSYRICRGIRSGWRWTR
jgi:putative ABC transport system substrate-binding protein